MHSQNAFAHLYSNNNSNMILDITANGTSSTNSNNVTSQRVRLGTSPKSSALLRFPPTTSLSSASSSSSYAANEKKAGASSVVVIKSTSDPALVEQETVQVEDSASSTATTAKSERKVRFNDFSFSKVIHEPCEAVDPSLLWWSREELTQTARSIQHVVQDFVQERQRLAKVGIKYQYKRGQPPRSDLRGLEDIVSPASMKARQLRSRQVKQQVFSEQKGQAVSGDKNPLYIAARCQEFSRIALSFARQRAEWDALASSSR